MKYLNNRLLAVSSEGGHWVQLSRLKKLFSNFETYYCCTDESLSYRFEKGAFYSVSDVNRDNLFRGVITAFGAIKVLLKVRPAVVVTTGALPGLIFVFLAKYFFRSKVVWIDSIANGEELSFSGKMAIRFVDLHLSQWPEVASAEGSKYMGRVL